MGSFWARGSHLGRAWDLMWGPSGKSCETLAKCGFQMGGFGVLGAPLGCYGAFLCDPGQRKERPEVRKKRFWGYLENIDIPMCFLCFQKLADPSGGPSGCLEAPLGRTWGSWGSLLGHVGTSLCQSVGFECYKGSLFRCRGW